MKKVCIVLPTYNEAQNMEPLLAKIFKQQAKIKNYELNVLVVDDNSPDGTGKIVEKLSKKNKKLHLLKGTKQGLGVAYIRGFKYVMEKIKPEIIFEMDADFSHPPKLIPEFVKAIDSGHDFVIGSRYVPGGAVPDWNFQRKAISAGGNFFARIVAGIFEVHDCTSGFRAIRTNFLKKINLDKLGAKGYSFQMNLLYEAKKAGAKFKEVPLVFYDRKKGSSKMKTKDLVEFFFNAFHLRLRSWARFVRFCIVGGTGVIVNTGMLALFTEVFGVYYKISALIAIQTAILWNFFLNDRWTFKKSTNKSKWYIKLLKFEGISIIGAIINWAVLVLFTDVFGIYYLVSNLIGIVAATMWNFLANHFYTWRDIE